MLDLYSAQIILSSMWCGSSILSKAYENDVSNVPEKNHAQRCKEQNY